jgi:nitroimidazol reductase NimA-like FMN-containing flavoprotein (pyridoxamine 5'-phosphate oxidase superfamily)
LESQEETRHLLKELLTSQRFAVLATQSEAGPYASLIAFWAPGDLSHVVFATMRATRKFNYLVTHPRVALLFDSRSNRDADVREAVAVTATGTARELTDEGDRAAASRQFLAKHPQLGSFVASPGCAFVSVVVDTYYAVTHFQSVVELHMPGSGHAG